MQEAGLCAVPSPLFVMANAALCRIGHNEQRCARCKVSRVRCAGLRPPLTPRSERASACRQPVELKILGRQRQRRIRVGTTMRSDCAPLSIPPSIMRDFVAPAARAIRGWITAQAVKPQTCANLRVRLDWTGWGTEGFLGLPMQPGARRCKVPWS